MPTHASMRPRRIRRGERPTQRGEGNVSAKLQCGHGEFAVENPAWSRSLRQCPRPLQCGHGEFAVENMARAVDRIDVEVLQCGHGEFAVENRTLAGVHGWSNGASMRPRRIRRGEPEHGAGAARAAASSFNAATANSPWRTSKPPMPANKLPKGFNAATANSPWRTLWAGVCSTGAAGRLQCGHGEFAVENFALADALIAESKASMRPRRIRRGELGA